MSSYGFRTIRGKIGGKRVAVAGSPEGEQFFYEGGKSGVTVASVGNTRARRCSPTSVGRKTRLLLSVACAATVTALFTFLVKQISGGENELSRLELSAISPRNTRKLRLRLLCSSRLIPSFESRRFPTLLSRPPSY